MQLGEGHCDLWRWGYKVKGAGGGAKHKKETHPRRDKRVKNFPRVVEERVRVDDSQRCTLKRDGVIGR